MSSRTTVVLIALAAVACGVAFAAGVALGPTLDPPPDGSTAQTETAADSPAVLARLDRLSDEMHDLRAALDGNPPEEPHERRRERVEVAPGTRSVPAPDGNGDESGAGDGAPFRDEALERLAGIERRLALLGLGAAADRVEALPKPPGIDSKDFFRVLKGLDGNVVKAAHRLWDESQVRDAYGAPDTIVDHGGYIEWIYSLGQDEQFDFHFERGLCTMAH